MSPASLRGRTETSSEKTLSVMDLFTPERPEWTVEAACDALSLSESTVYRYFRSLAAAGLIFSIRPGRYLLGPGIVHYDRQLRTSDPLLRAAEPSILQLTEIYRGPGTIFISRIYRDHIMSMHEFRLGGRFAEGTYGRGLLAPMFGGAPGLAILAFLEVRTARSLFQKHAPADEGEWLQIKRRMRAARASGYAAGVDEPDRGITYVSVPVLQDQGGVAGSLSLALPSEGADVALAGKRLIRAASQIAQWAASHASYDPVVSDH